MSSCINAGADARASQPHSIANGRFEMPASQVTNKGAGRKSAAARFSSALVQPSGSLLVQRESPPDWAAPRLVASLAGRKYDILALTHQAVVSTLLVWRFIR